MDDWLSAAADALSEAASVPRESLDLDDGEVRELLDLARIAAHDSGQRTNAPLLCYLVGLAGRERSVDVLAEAVRRSTS